MSRDAVAVASLLGTFATLWLLTSTFARQMAAYMIKCLEAVGGEMLAMDSIATEFGARGALAVGRTAGLLAAVAVLCAVAATFAQTRFLVSGEAIRPKFSRLNPLEGFKRLFSLKSAVESLKGILKISVLLVIIFMSIRDMFLESSRYLYTDLSAACAHLVEVAMGMVVRIAIAFVALAALDFFYQWWEYERQMKMTKQEVKEEYKQMEGDPQVKGKIKELQRRRAQSRMMQQVPGADVVIRNPTHFAVALRYKPEQDNAPIVLAKGQDSIAARIVQIAEEHKIAVIENVPLARALYAQTDLNMEIPPELYNAVAEVLVYIFHIDEKQRIVK